MCVCARVCRLSDRMKVLCYIDVYLSLGQLNEVKHVCISDSIKLYRMNQQLHKNVQEYSS